MHHLVSEADEPLKQVKVFDLSRLEGVLQSHGEQDWAHAHITIRSITIKGVVYSIESEQKQEMPMESDWTCDYSRALPMQVGVLSLTHHKDHPKGLPSISLHPSPGSTKRDDLPGYGKIFLPDNTISQKVDIRDHWGDLIRTDTLIYSHSGSSYVTLEGKRVIGRSEVVDGKWCKAVASSVKK